MYRDREDRGGGYRGGNNNSNFGGDRQRFAPVREGDELDVKIEAVGEKGDGIAKKQGFVLFVPKTKSGDEVRVRVTRVLKNAGFAEVIGSASAPIVSSTEQQPRQKTQKKEEEFAPKTEDDSENFGEESDAEAEEVAEKSDDAFDENAEETQEN